MPWLAGYPREKINWFPTIEQEKCVKCGICMNCGKNVFEWTKDGPRVVQPYQCVVGCNTCANLCRGDAIRFPEINEVREIYRREKIWDKVKEALKAEGKLND